MRLELNLYKYCDKLKIEHINKIWGMMLDMKPTITDLELLYSLDRELTSKEATAKKIRILDLEYKILTLDDYMKELKQQPIFGIKKGDLLCDEVLKQVLAKYLFLISETSNT